MVIENTQQEGKTQPINKDTTQIHFIVRDLFDGFTADAWFSLTESGEKEEENGEEANKERLEKNKEWRRRKEEEKRKSQGLPPPEDPEAIKEKNRKVARKLEKKLHKEFLCTNCG